MESQEVSMKKLLKLKEARKSRGVSQFALAARMGVDQPTVSKWESGARIPFPHTIERIAKALKCKASEL
jgi:transcriptional regulator with XRE-family HTH domain